jgi:hypothetical protein
MSRPVRVFLDGDLVEDRDVSGIEDARLTLDQNNEDGVLAVSFGSEFVFTGAAYSYVISRLVDSPTATTNSIRLRVDATCCTNTDGSPLTVFEGLVSRGEISWCEKGLDRCIVNVSALENSAESLAINCLKNTIIHSRRGQNGASSSGENEGRTARYVGYYDETRPYSFAYLTLLAALYLLTITATIRLIIVVATLGTVSFNDSTRFILAIFAKKRYHKAPFISSYLANACKLCGLQLRAPLFQAGGAYYNLMRLDAPFAEGGTTIVKAETAWRKFNRPNISFAEFLGSFRDLNLTYAVAGNTLIFDRIDRVQSQLWIDFSTNERTIYEQCYEADDKVQPALELFEYTNDGTDKIGNEANRLWSGEVVDYNTPFNPILTGVKRTTIPYGTARFIEDGDTSALSDIVNSPLYSVSTFGANSIDKKAMLMSAGTCVAPKLLMWDGISPAANGHVLRQATVSGNYAYSVPSWLNQSALPTFGTAGFYDNLLAISDPRRNLKKNLVFRVRFKYLCEDLRTIGYGQFVRIQRGSQIVRGDVQSIEIDLNNGEITVTGII